MKRLILWMALATIVPGIAQADCGRLVDVTSGMSYYTELQANAVTTVTFNPDVSGTETTAAIELEVCMDATNTAANACLDYEWDSDGDGTPDTNILDGSSVTKTGVVIEATFPYLRIATSTNPSGTDEPQFVICRRSTK